MLAAPFAIVALAVGFVEARRLRSRIAKLESDAAQEAWTTRRELELARQAYWALTERVRRAEERATTPAADATPAAEAMTATWPTPPREEPANDRALDEASEPAAAKTNAAAAGGAGEAAADGANGPDLDEVARNRSVDEVANNAALEGTGAAPPEDVAPALGAADAAFAPSTPVDAHRPADRADLPHASPASPPPPDAPDAPVPSPEPGATPGTSLEERIGLVWLTRIGAAVLLLGVAYFFKYAVDNAWIGPLGRVVLGAVVGAGILGGAETLRARTKPIFANALLGIGLAVLTFSAYAAHAFYALVPSAAAIGAVAVVALLGGVLAVRYRADAILVLSTASALAAPVLLSTGEDRPLALFAYALVVGALAQAAAVRADLRVSPWVATVFAAGLFVGWYGKFFDAAAGVSTRDLVVWPGAYHLLAARVVPLVAVACFAAQWLAVAAATRARRPDAIAPLALAIVALLFAHVGAALLLFDHAGWLTLSLVVLGALAQLVARREKRPWIPLVSLIASGIALAASAHRAAQTPLVPMLALAAWAVVYVAPLVVRRGDAPRGGDAESQALRGDAGSEAPRALRIVLPGLAALNFVLVAAILLGPHHGLTFLSVLAVVSAGVVALGLRERSAALVLVALVLSAPFVWVGAPEGTGIDGRFLALVGAWAATYALGSFAGVIFRKDPPSPGPVVTAALAGLAFVGFSLVHTHASHDLLRAALVGAAGVVELGLGMLVLRKDARRLATVLLGLGLSLFVAAVAFLFSGATTTLVWAAVAAIVIVLAAREEDPAWLAGGFVLFVLVTARLLAFDLDAPARARELWFSSHGASGALAPLVFLNPRSYALGATAVAAFVGAHACGRARPDWYRVPAAFLLVFGHAALLLWVVLETRGMAFRVPSLDARSPEAPYLWEEAVTAQAGGVGLATTLAIGTYAAVVVALGFGRRSALHRYLGLALFALALGKLGTHDIWDLPRVFQIGALVGTGVLLLSASFLYARFGKRLVALFKTGGAALALLATSWEGRADAAEPVFTHRAPVVSDVREGELVAIPVPPPFYRIAREGFADLRVVDEGGEVPYLVRAADRTAREAPARRELPMVDPGRLPDGSFRATFDLGEGPHDHVDLRLAGRNFVRVTRVESSLDGREWVVLAEGARVYRVEGPESTATSERVRYPTSRARWLRVTLLAASDDQKPTITGASTTVVGAADAAAPPAPPVLEGATLSKRANGKSEDLFVDLGQGGVPVRAVVLVVATPVFSRWVSVAASDDPGATPAAWFPAGEGLVYRTEGPKGVAESTRVTLSSPRRGRHLRITVKNGDDAPLAVTEVRPEYAREELVVRARKSGALAVVMGNPGLSAPSYDLAATLPRPDVVDARRVEVGPLEKVAELPKPPAAPKSFTDRHEKVLGALLVVVLAALALWTAQLLFRSSDGEGGSAG